MHRSAIGMHDLQLKEDIIAKNAPPYQLHRSKDKAHP